MDLARELKKVIEREGSGDISHSWSPENSPLITWKETELEIKGRIETSQATAMLKSAGIIRVQET